MCAEPRREPGNTFALALGVLNLNVFNYVPMSCAITTFSFYHVLLIKVCCVLGYHGVRIIIAWTYRAGTGHVY